MKLSTGAKVFLVLFFLGISILGFMLKLPPAFRKIDKEMHTLYYFVAAAFLNIIWAKRNLLKHGFVFLVLYLFGIAIEHAQEYSNKFFNKRIHGRYDIEDVQGNLKGLILFSAVWVLIVLFGWFVEKSKESSGKNFKEIN